MNMLSNDAIDLLSMLMQVASDHAKGLREEATIDLVELNGKMGGKPRTPWRNDEATNEALGWCDSNGVPAFPLMMVLDANYRHPDGSLLRAAFPGLSRAESRNAWAQAIEAIAALDAPTIDKARAILPEKVEVKAAQARKTNTTKPAAVNVPRPRRNRPRRAPSAPF